MRRNYLVVLLALCIVLGAAAFAGAQDFDPPVEYPTPAAYEAATGRNLPSYGEAPELAARVAAGELERVEERLPLEPRVIQPVEAIGKYGGNLRRAWLGPSDRWNVRHFIGESFITTTVDAVPIPNVAKSWEVLDNHRCSSSICGKNALVRRSSGHIRRCSILVVDQDRPRLYHPHSDWMLQNGKR